MSHSTRREDGEDMGQAATHRATVQTDSMDASDGFVAEQADGTGYLTYTAPLL